MKHSSTLSDLKYELEGFTVYKEPDVVVGPTVDAHAYDRTDGRLREVVDADHAGVSINEKDPVRVVIFQLLEESVHCGECFGIHGCYKWQPAQESNPDTLNQTQRSYR